MLRRLVVDSNMIQSPMLRDYLAEGGGNLAVLADVLWVEMYKQGSLPGVTAAFSVIRDFPDQLIVLRPGREIAEIDPTEPGFARLMCRDGVAGDIRDMTAALNLAMEGDSSVLAGLAAHWSDAARVMDGMLEGAAEIAASLPEVADTFTPNEVRQFRCTERLSVSMQEKVFGATDQIHETLLGGYATLPGHLCERRRYDGYLYRLSLAIVVYSLWWIRNGNQMPKRLDRVRNDIIDLTFAVYATYFTGLMSEDAKARWMYQHLCGGLRFAGATPPNSLQG